MIDVVLVLAGFAAGVVVSQLGLVTLLLVGRRLLRRRRPTRTSTASPPAARGWAADELPGAGP